MSQAKKVSNLDGLLTRQSGPWIHRKYFYLKRYCDIFTRGMKSKWKQNLTYIDLFSGPGRCLVKSTQEDVEGSALIALQYDFSKYIFVEENKKCLEVLKKRCSKSPKFRQIHFIQGDCNRAVDAIIQALHPGALNLFFIDPTGIDIDYNTIKQLTDDRRADLIVNIQFGMDIKRNFDRYKKKGDASVLGRFLGGSVNWTSLQTPRDAIKFYKERIAKLRYSTVEFKDIEIRNTKNAPLYFLLFASKSPRGLDYWEKITAVDNLGQQEMNF